MSEPVQRSHFWVFDDSQLEAALMDWDREMTDQAVSPGNRAVLVDGARAFLHSQYCVENGMRRGGSND